MAPRAPSRPAGTGYIGLDQWLNLNRQQASGMADSLVSGINTKGTKAEGLLGDAVERLNYDVDGNRLTYDDTGLINKDGTPKADSVFEADKRAKDAQAIVDAGWAGPKGIDKYASYGDGRTVAAEAQRDASLATDQYGRQSLLQNQYGKGGGYSLGQQRLDSALVGAAGGDKLDGAKAQWGGLLGKFDSAYGAANARIANVTAENARVAKQYADAAAVRRPLYESGLKDAQKAEADRLKRSQDQGKAERTTHVDSDRAAVESGRIPADAKGRTPADDWDIPGSMTRSAPRPKQPPRKIF